MIADTSFIIDVSRGDKKAIEKAKALEKRREPLAITVVTVFELWQGCGLLSGHESELMSKFIDKSMIISMDHESAREAGIIRSTLKTKGITLAFGDSMIAGIVISGNDTLLTRNVKHFSRIEGMHIETY